jgi:hypothetical protein
VVGTVCVFQFLKDRVESMEEDLLDMLPMVTIVLMVLVEEEDVWELHPR